MERNDDEQLITEILSQLRFGTLDTELGEKFHELVNRVENTNRQGTLTLTLKVKPAGKGRIDIIDDIKLSLPKEEKGSSVMFVTPEGRLQRQDPRQLEIEALKNVDRETGEIKQVSAVKPTNLRRAV